MKHVLDDIGNTCLWASSVMIVIWVIQYSILAPWWRHFMGITIVGLALCVLAIYIPSLMALADPSEFATFAQARWYLYLTVGIVVATAIFLGTRITLWELIRRQRGRDRPAAHLLPSAMAARLSELESENARLREQITEGPVD